MDLPRATFPVAGHRTGRRNHINYRPDFRDTLKLQQAPKQVIQRTFTASKISHFFFSTERCFQMKKKKVS